MNKKKKRTNKNKQIRMAEEKKSVAVHISTFSVQQGDEFSVRVQCPGASKFSNMQVDIFSAGELNREFRYGIGSKPISVGDDFHELALSAKSLAPGLYEVMVVGFHGEGESDESRCFFQSGRDYPRVLFEVRGQSDLLRSKMEVEGDVLAREYEHSKRLMEEVDVRKNANERGSNFAIFVFVKDVYIQTQVNFRNYQIVPTNRGLESLDTWNFVNDFLRSNTSTSVNFKYGAQESRQSNQNNPVCVVHFPNVVASSAEEAHLYCRARTEDIVLCLNLIRDSGGQIFDVVVFNHDIREAIKFFQPSQYVGNLLGGHLSGEGFDRLNQYLTGIERNDLTRFLLVLFREARRERHVDYQYVRLWQILEILAASRNYPPGQELLDYNGSLMLDHKGNPRTVGHGPNAVFALFRDLSIGKSDEMWLKVLTWYAFRNAVIHHGAVANFEQLDQAYLRDVARTAFGEIAKTPGHDSYLFNLKEDLKLVLMRALSGRL